MNRKILAYIFLIIAIIPVSYSLTLVLKKVWIKHSMLEALENRSLEVIKTNVSLVQWIDKDELIIGGKYFDVQSYNVCGQTIILKGLFDDKEDALSLQIEQSYNLADNNASTGEMHTLVLLLQPLLLHENLMPDNFFLKALLPFSINSSNILQRQKFVDTPPPKTLC